MAISAGRTSDVSRFCRHCPCFRSWRKKKSPARLQEKAESSKKQRMRLSCLQSWPGLSRPSTPLLTKQDGDVHKRAKARRPTDVAATLSIGLGLLLCPDWRKIAPSVAENEGELRIVSGEISFCRG